MIAQVQQCYGVVANGNGGQVCNVAAGSKQEHDDAEGSRQDR